MTFNSKVTQGHWQCHPDCLDFVSETRKAGYIYFQTKNSWNDLEGWSRLLAM